jgi:hypothetical protein
LKEEYDELTDWKTGQQYFTPKLGKNTVNVRKKYKIRETSVASMSIYIV